MRLDAARLLAVLLLAAQAASAADGAPADVEARIAAAVAPAPPALRETATVYDWTADGELTLLRQGTGELICLADDPRDERFHVACYHRDLDAFMARGRELRAAGKERDELQKSREEEIEAGTLAMPKGPTALYSLTGKPGTFDPASGRLAEGTRVSVIYIPFATEASTGLPPEPVSPGGPWLMSAGKPWAHIMVVQPAESPEPPAAPAD
jgi:hypothetical protein